MFDFNKAITRCMTEYNLDREEATRIIKTPNSDLTINDLRYKYGNMQLGIAYPDWITPENLLNMCYNVVKKYNYNGYYWYYSADELAKDLFIWATIRLNKLNNYSLLKKSLCDQCKTIMRDLIRQQSPNLTSISLYKQVDTSNQKTDQYYVKDCVNR